jgi:hypothetical protein
MQRTFTLFLCACLLLCLPLVYGQNVEVSEPKLELRNNTIHISYDILNSTSSEAFSVELIVRDADGNQIPTTALTGDVGEVVSGGSGKQITWDLAVEKIEMNAQISVKIYVTAVPPAPETDAPVPPAPVSGEKTFSRSSLMLQSALFPGLGLSRYRGGPHWIKGVAGYSCLAGAVIMNRKAISTFEDIYAQTDYDEQDKLYQESLNQDKVSEILVYTAIGIWVSDLVWTFVASSDLNRSSATAQRFRVNSSFDQLSFAPMLAFTYQF